MNKISSITLSLLVLSACQSETSAPAGKAPARFAAVKKSTNKSAKRFCDKVFDGKGKAWTPPPERPLPGPTKTVPNPKGKAWTWVNLWATWCGPCVEEMPLLRSWKAALQKEGLPLKMQLWTIDAEGDDLKGALTQNYPGDIHWLKNEEALPGLLSSLGLSQNTAIPVHALLDPEGKLRCVRVGKVGQPNYAAIKSILGGAL